MYLYKCIDVHVMIKFTYQHCSTKIEFVEKLCDENMNLKYISDVLTFYISEYINKPLKMFV